MISAGLLLPTRELAIAGGRDARALVEFARLAERCRFDSVWAGDSLLSRPRVEPLALLAAVAAATSEIGLGTAALTAALRHPLLTAHTVATVDLISGGRLTLGLGAGFPYPQTRAEFGAAGVPFGERTGRLLETVRLWRLLWADPAADSFTGRYWTFTGLTALPRPARPGGPALWLAGAGPRAAERVGSLFDGWLPYLPEPAEYARQLALIRASGRPVTPALYVTVLPSEDPRQLDAYTRAYYGVPVAALARLQAFVTGTPGDCARRLRAYTAAGARHLVIRIGALDPLPYLETIAAIREEVLA